MFEKTCLLDFCLSLSVFIFIVVDPFKCQSLPYQELLSLSNVFKSKKAHLYPEGMACDGVNCRRGREEFVSGCVHVSSNSDF